MPQHIVGAKSKGDVRLETLTDAAADMFLERGYESVSLDELISRAGGSRRNIYSHFGGKQGLFIKVVTKLCNEQAQPIEQLDIADCEVATALELFGRHTLEIVLQPRTLALHRLMIAEGYRFPELAQAIWRSGHDKATQILAKWFETRRSELRQDVEPQILAAQFIELLVTRAQLRALVGLHSEPHSPEEIAQLVEVALHTFLSGCTPDSASALVKST